MGADAALVVTPYYNRPSPAGVVAHFRRVAEVGLPVIVYEIPHRTGLALPVDTIREILELEGVVGIKDSTPGVQLVTELSRLGSKPVLCGEDSQWFAALCCGAAGGMLASANVRTAQFTGLFRSFAAGQTAEAKRAFDELLPLIRLLFAEPNPGPLKWLLAREGVIGSDAMRLPMTGISARLQAELAAQRV
uniref:4-hydroxy-tetrahydrodipicolinate synthase n=1 Tax=Paenibacillus athensensis TaxID=1967502 RepID=A0A4Y8PQZ1_9BACL